MTEKPNNTLENSNTRKVSLMMVDSNRSLKDEKVEIKKGEVNDKKSLFKCIIWHRKTFEICFNDLGAINSGMNQQ